jgi:hypothetical protein
MRLVFLALVVTACTACPGGKYKPPPQMRTAQQIVADLAARGAKATTFRATTISDYWLQNQRLKGTVKMMGTPDSKVRFYAYDPMDNVILDLVCDGTDFLLVDRQNNCILTGPCNGDSIARLLRVPLEPADFFLLAVGLTPVVPGATGKVTWDSDHGYEVVELTGDGGQSQTITIDAREGKNDVVKSELRGADGKTVWTVDNKSFDELQTADATPFTVRVPGSSWFKSPGKNSDVIVDWNERDMNAALPEAAFKIEVPMGIATCGQTQGQPAQPASGAAPPKP